MKTFETDFVTKNLLQLCYTCDDAHQCQTEEQCKACWAENGMIPEQEDETKHFLDLVHA
ncbi:hypothetical protein SAMN04487895_101204 [Paenibacillus sophorae]|uniref:Uncharacterized protein n=1 Tax=Paenibacillus sophorae TaxID=1333845 RepID=A0A1H8FQE8_9BACL|nr:hypothetical protein [Paenibacillus sophorae]QWU13944.1 hypothetical protein KP014_18580 [Paenibacillus sophorae]SEN33889.1 hypothetical protein SAMN04487895_101204 [Paenibacillus sophorae]